MVRSVARRQGFTLLELLVVIAILAIIAGSIVVAYDRLTQDAARGHAAHAIGSLDSAVRSYKSVNKFYPDNYDSLLFDGTTLVNVMTKQGPNQASGGGGLWEKTGPYVLAPQAVNALKSVGVSRVLDVSSTVTNVEFGSYNNARPTTAFGGTGTQPEQPMRIFDDPLGEGWGASRTLAAGQTVVALTGIAVPNWLGQNPGNDARANKVANLPSNVAHIVVVLGVGNNCTLVDKAGNRKGSISEVPNYGNTLPQEYNRCLAIFLVATDQDGNGTIDPTDYLSEAQFLGIVVTDLDHRDEEKAKSGL